MSNCIKATNRYVYKTKGHKNVLPLLMVLVFISASQLANAQIDQQSYDLKKIIPPSPNASSLGKYADWPVDLYTGVPKIEIPLYEVKGRSLSVPVSVNYHGSGIKVSENASCVGLGWSLLAGGVITRSVRGIADEDQGPGYFTIRSYYKNPGDLSLGAIATDNNNASSDSMIRVSIANGNADSQPDLYVFSAMGRSYKFLFLGDGTIITKPYSNVKVSFNYTNVSQSSWTVILEDGTKLFFGGGGFVETTTTQQTSTVPDPFISSWYLQSITSPTGEKITFTYYGSNVVTLDSYVYEADYAFNYIEVNQLKTGVPSTTKLPKKIVQTSDVNFLTPATIESELCKVYFDTISRADLPGSVAVSGIRVYSKSQNKVIRSYLLNYGYSTAIASNMFTGGYNTPPSRLKLNAIEEIPADNSPHKFWRFAYNPLTLPSRKSYAQDYWGYYNGATSNTTLKPFNINFNPDKYVSGNRSADSASMMAEMLTQISYPTGGYSQFAFEPNSYPANEEQFQTVPVNQSLYLTYNQPNFTNTTSSTLIITKSQYFKFQFTGSFSAAYLRDYGSYTTLASAVLKDSLGNTITSAAIKNPTPGTSTTVNSQSIMLRPGTYTFTTSSSSSAVDFSSPDYTVSLNSTFSYLGSLGIKAVNHLVGGVRIKSIVYVDSTVNANIVKSYTYAGANVVVPLNPDNDFVGPVTDRMWDCNGTLTVCSIPGCLASSVVYYERSASLQFGLGSQQGGTVCYTWVTESLGANGEGGKTVYNFNFIGDADISLYLMFPYVPVSSVDYKRGLLLQKYVYTSAGALISKTTNSYQFIKKGIITTFKVGYKYNILSSCYSLNFLSDIIERKYYQEQADQVQKITTTDTVYDLSSGGQVATVSNYFYDNPVNSQPIRIETTDSKGSIIKTINRTPLEKADINSTAALTTPASAAIDTLLTRNTVSPVLQTEKWNAGTLLSRTIVNYRNWDTIITQPENVQIQYTTNPIETRLQFTGYDGKGNLIQQLKAGDITHTYLYDYLGNYPIAEATNADTASIAYSSFEADGSGRWSISSPIRDSSALTGRLSYNLINGAISKNGLTSGVLYYITYWTKTGSKTLSLTGTQTAPDLLASRNGWSLYRHSFTLTSGASSISITGAGVIDELRLYPIGSQMITFTYDPLLGVTSQCDVNNRVIYYEYDGFGRLKDVRDQDNNILKTLDYYYRK